MGTQTISSVINLQPSISYLGDLWKERLKKYLNRW